MRFMIWDNSFFSRRARQYQRGGMAVEGVPPEWSLVGTDRYVCEGMHEGRAYVSSLHLCYDEPQDGEVDPITLEPPGCPNVVLGYVRRCNGGETHKGETRYSIESIGALLEREGSDARDPMSRLPIPVPHCLVRVESLAFSLLHIARAVASRPTDVLLISGTHGMEALAHRVGHRFMEHQETTGAMRCTEALAACPWGREVETFFDTLLRSFLFIMDNRPCDITLNAIFMACVPIVHIDQEAAHRSGMPLTAAFIHPSDRMIDRALSSLGVAYDDPDGAAGVVSQCMESFLDRAPQMEDRAWAIRVDRVAHFLGSTTLTWDIVGAFCLRCMPLSATRASGITGRPITEVLASWPASHIAGTLACCRDREAGTQFADLAERSGVRLMEVLECACAMRNSNAISIVMDATEQTVVRAACLSALNIICLCVEAGAAESERAQKPPSESNEEH